MLNQDKINKPSEKKSQKKKQTKLKTTTNNLRIQSTFEDKGIKKKPQEIGS